MKVLSIDPSSKGLKLALVDGDAKAFKVPFKTTWPVDDEDRLASLVEIRKRLLETLAALAPDVVCVIPLEPMALRGGKRGSPDAVGRARMSWFHTAELRGVIAEGARSTIKAVEFRAKAAVTRGMGGRGASFIDDEAFWEKELGPDFPKKYREVVLVGVSKLRQGP